MPVRVLLSTAYLPPAEYFARIAPASEVSVEREENYHKQSYRNRCYIQTATGPQALTVPVYLGSFHKTPVKDIRIDYSKRWQKVHLGAINAAYGSAPYFIYYYDSLEKVIMKNHEFLLDLNMELLHTLLIMLKMDVKINYTTSFLAPDNSNNDFRYCMSPKIKSEYQPKPNVSILKQGKRFSPGLSIINMIFILGPDAKEHL